VARLISSKKAVKSPSSSASKAADVVNLPSRICSAVASFRSGVAQPVKASIIIERAKRRIIEIALGAITKIFKSTLQTGAKLRL
jgi:hypothetical protein